MKEKETIPSKKEIEYFKKEVAKWFCKNKRIFPWRETKDPFKVLLAEIMLRRTKAEQVEVVYNKFIKKYPDVNSILKAGDEDLKEILYPLGLKWRLKTFKIVAIELKRRFDCEIPDGRKELETLTGVGKYVAGAVCSIAFDKKEWIVDSNVGRLINRYFGVEPSGEARRDKKIIEISKIYISSGNPKKNNLALLDFSALICAPNPKCKTCPLTRKCCYYNNIKFNQK